LNYWNQYQLLAIVWDKKDEKDRSTLPDTKNGVGNTWWVDALKVSPILDVWAVIEKKMYGDIVTSEVKEYDNYTKARILLYPPE
jgi:hypothetical protein